MSAVTPDVPAEWVATFNAAVAAVGCPRCGRTVPCRCYVPREERPDKVAVGLAAVAPLIRAQIADDVLAADDLADHVGAAMYEHERTATAPPGPLAWAELGDSMRSSYLDLARVAIDAVTPLIRAQILAEQTVAGLPATGDGVTWRHPRAKPGMPASRCPHPDCWTGRIHCPGDCELDKETTP